MNKILSLLCMIFILQCGNVTDEESACKYRAKKIFDRCLVASFIWPSYLYGRKSDVNSSDVTTSIAFCNLDHIHKLTCPNKSKVIPTGKTIRDH
ncbi:MAG: hypothetical protein K8R21_14250 [Leptospira sp.]|nr:hypothetical protein [Leptospira sp.]